MSERTRYLTTSKHLLSSGADAVERLMSSYKVKFGLAANKNRINYDLFVHEAKKKIYLFFFQLLIIIIFILFIQELVALAGYANRVSEMLDVFKDAALCKYQRNVVMSQQNRGSNGTVPTSMERLLEFKDGVPMIKGIVRESLDGSIGLADVPIVTPNCEVIVSSLTIEVTSFIITN